MVNRPLGVAGVIIVRSEPRAGGSWRAVCTVPNGASRTDGEITRYTRCCETQPNDQPLFRPAVISHSIQRPSSLTSSRFNCIDQRLICPVAKDEHHCLSYPLAVVAKTKKDSTKQRSECHVFNLTNAPEKDKHICCVSVYEPPP